MLKNMINRNAIIVLVISRVMYAANWFNVASIFSLIATDMNESVSGLGLITTSFLVGMGLFQVPSGIVAAKVGPRKTAFYGTLLYSVSVLLTGLAATFYQLVFLRFLVGVGMAFIFAPGVSLVTKYFRRGSEGLGVGIFNTAYDVGGAAGLFVWAIIAELTGWRLSLVGAGALGLVTAFLLLLTVPGDTIREEFRITASGLKRLLLDRWILELSLCLVGIGIGTNLAGNFVVFYLENSLGADVVVAGAIGSMALLIALVIAPFAGRIYDAVGDVRKILVASTLMLALSVGLLAANSLYAALAGTVLVGLSSGVGFTIIFSATRAANRNESEYETLAVSWVNMISFAGAWVPTLFSYIADSQGYSTAWITGALVTLVWILPTVFARRKGA